MDNDHKVNYLLCSKLLTDELDEIQAIISVTKASCEQKEQNCNYYDAPKNFILNLSEERNCYIRIFRILSEKVAKATDLNLNLEDKLFLEQNTDYSSR